MRYGLKTQNIGEKVALAAGKLPLPLVDTLIPLIQLRCIMAAVRLGVFEALRAERSFTAEELAKATGTNPGVLLLLLRTLASGGYVVRHNSSFALTAAGRRHLLKGAPFDLTASVQFMYWELDMLDSLEDVLVSGRGLDIHSAYAGEAAMWPVYQRSMLEIASGGAETFAKMIEVPGGATLLLDVAGSHGLNGAALCRLHPPLKSIVLELPQALDAARALAAEAGIIDVVEHREGNLLQGELPGPADVVLLSNILHHFSREQILHALRRMLAALRPGGALVVCDAERKPDSAPSELAGDAMGLFFRVLSESEVYSADDYVALLSEAGAQGVSVKRSIMHPVMVLVQGKKA